MSSDSFFVVCIEADETDDLVVGRTYRAQPDGPGERSALIRVWDDSGQDYLYPAEAFIRVDVERSDSERPEGALMVHQAPAQPRAAAVLALYRGEC